MFSIRRSFAWMALSQGGLFVLQFGTSVLLAWLLTPYEMGVFAVAMAIVGLLSILRSLGLSGYIVRAKELTLTLQASVFTVNAVLAIFVSALTVGLSTIGGALLGEPGVRRLLMVVAVLPLVNIFDLLPATGLERSGNFRVIALLNLLRTVVANAVTLSSAYVGFSYMSLAYGQIAGAFVWVIAVNIIGRQYACFRFGLAAWRDIMNYGLQMLAISGITALASRLAELLLGRILGLEALGIYSRASSLNSQIWDNVHVIITRIIFVDLAEKKRQNLSLRDSYLRVMEMTTALLWPAFTGLAVIAGPVVLVLYGQAWVGAALPLSFLSLSAVILVSITMTWEVFVVCRETARQAQFEFIRAGVGLAMFVVGCFISLPGAAVARVGEAMFAVFIYRPHLERMTDTTLRDSIPIYLHSAMLTALAVLPAVVVMTIYSWSPATPFPAVLIAVFLGMIGWGFGLRALQHPLFHEVRLIVSKLSQSR